MTTYYKYAEREAAQTIDWTAISKSLVNTLEAENKRREELKAQIDKNSVKFGEQLDNAPTGDYKNANTWVLEASDKGQQMRLMQDQLLKSGQLKLKDYLIQRQNTESGFKNVFAVAKEYQDEYKVKMDAFLKGQSSGVTVDMMETIEGLANLTNTDMYINPTNGVMSLARTKTKDGVKTATGEYVSVSALRNRLKTNVEKFNTNNLDKDVAALGETVVTDIKRSQGLRRIIEIEKTNDPTQRQALKDDPEIGTYYKWEEARANEYLANPFTAASILKDYVRTNPDGENFKLTYNKEEWEKDETGKLYLLEDDGSGIVKPVFKEGQEEQIKKFIKNEYRNRIDREQTITLETEPDIYRPSAAEQEYYRGIAADRDKTKNNLNMAAQLYYGNDADIDAASQYFRDIIPNVKDVVRTENGVTLTFNDKSSRTIKFKDANGNVIPQDKWLASATGLHGITDVPSAIRQSGYRADRGFNTSGAGSSSVTPPPKAIAVVDQRKSLNDILAKKAISELSVEDEPSTTAANLTGIFKPLGFSFNPVVKGSADYVEIFKDGKYVGAVEISGDDAGAQQIESYLRNSVESQAKVSEDAVTRIQGGYK